jgi:hypothetical protein
LIYLTHTSIYRSGKYMTMPRLSLYRPEKGNDFKFIDKSIWEMFQIGGTDVFVHKYLGPGSSTDASPTTPSYTGNSVSNIQDLLFLENRDRKYDSDIYLLRGIYNIQDTDFNLSQFGLFLQNDTIFVNFHINDTVEKIGRKLIAGDVIELPHLKDQFALNDFKFSLKRFYVIEEVSRAAEGFSATWYPHLYRAKCKPLVDSQEFSEILDGLADDTGTDTSTSLRDILSTYEKEMQITQAVLDQAESDAPRSGYDTTAYYSIQLDQETGRTTLVSVDASTITIDQQVQATDESGFPLVDDNGDPVYVGSTASTVTLSPHANGYDGYLLGDGIPPNGAPFTAGTGFPPSATEGQFCLRLDFMPKRLFRFNGIRWVKFEDQVRMTMSNLGASDVAESGDVFEGKDIRSTQKASFINNDNTDVINGKTIKERQSLSKALRPKADE